MKNKGFYFNNLTIQSELTGPGFYSPIVRLHISVISRDFAVFLRVYVHFSTG